MVLFRNYFCFRRGRQKQPQVQLIQNIFEQIDSTTKILLHTKLLSNEVDETKQQIKTKWKAA